MNGSMTFIVQTILRNGLPIRVACALLLITTLAIAEKQQPNKAVEKHNKRKDREQAESAHITSRDFYDYIRILAIPEEEVAKAGKQGQKWLSVGEGKSDFVAQCAKLGIDSMALDAQQVNPHAPERSKIGYAQDLPFKDGTFDRVVSVFLRA